MRALSPFDVTAPLPTRWSRLPWGSGFPRRPDDRIIVGVLGAYAAIAAGLAATGGDGSAWAGINPANFVPGQMPRHTSAQTLEKVALLFRQDAQLSADAARKLEQIVETAYHAFKGEETAPQAVKKK